MLTVLSLRIDQGTHRLGQIGDFRGPSGVPKLRRRAAGFAAPLAAWRPVPVRGATLLSPSSGCQVYFRPHRPQRSRRWISMGWRGRSLQARLRFVRATFRGAATVSRRTTCYRGVEANS
jgi:hypothetical protein